MTDTICVNCGTCAEETWRGFVGQTLRWNNGGLFSPDLGTRLGYNLLMLLITAGAIAFPLLPIGFNREVARELF